MKRRWPPKVLCTVALGGSWGWGATLVIFLSLLNGNCHAEDDVSVVTDDVFTKPTPSLAPAPEGPGARPPPTLSPTPPPTFAPFGSESAIIFDGQEDCKLYRDIWCLNVTEHSIDKVKGMNADEKEEAISRTMYDGLGVSYRPFVQGHIDYWAQNSTAEREAGWTGYTVKEPSDKFEVQALALGVVIKAISNIDSVEGTFDATLKLYYFNITEGPFDTVEEAMGTIYKDTSKTTVKDRQYFRLRDHEIDDAWFGGETEDGEHVHPDGVCKASTIKSMRPILAEDFNLSLIRLPHLNARIFPTPVVDEEGYLSYVDIIGASFKFKPINRKYFPVQIDLLDIFFEFPSADLIDEDQHIVKHLLCIHPLFSGFSNHVFGSDEEAGHGTSNSLSLIPYMFFDRVEPWIRQNYSSQFYYGARRQRSPIGDGSNLQRMLGLRIIVEQPSGKGWFEVLPILFVSLAAVANMISSDPEKIGGTSMVQALLGMNSLVTQNTQLIGPHTVIGQSLLLAYCITAIWILTVVFMMVINSAKNKSSGNLWYVKYQLKIFRYLRMFAGALCLLYIPFLSAYKIDKGSGKQEAVNWIWGIVVGIIAIAFIFQAMTDYKLVKKRKREKEQEAIKAMVFSHKPLNLWSQDEVLLWIRIGNLTQESYFDDAKRSSIEEKLEAAAADGELLSEFGTDIEKLVQFAGLSFGDAVKLAKELKLLVVKKVDSGDAETAIVLFSDAYKEG